MAVVTAAALVLSSMEAVGSPSVPVVVAAPAAAADVTEASGLFGAQQYARRFGHRVEVTSQRSESTSTFANPDGSLTTEAATQPVRVRRGDGWVPVDTTLVSDSSGVHPRAVPDSLMLSAGGNTSVVTLADAASKLGLGWPAKLPAPSLSGDTATYAGVAANVDLTVRVTRTGFELSIVLTAPPVKAPVFRLPLASMGLTAGAPDAAGVVTLKDRAGRGRGFVRPTVMFDAHRDAVTGEPTRTARVPARVAARSGGGQEIDLSPAASFLADPATTYPVTVDPTFHLGELNDMWVASDGTGGSGSQELRVGYYNGNSAVHRSYLKFDTTRMAGAVVSSATLSLYEWYTPAGCVPKESRIYGLGGAFGDSTTWSTQPGASPVVYGSSTAVFGDPGCPAGWVRYDVTGLAQNWAGGALANNGLLVRSANESDTSAWWRFYGMDFPSTTQLPTLAVTYNHAPITPTGSATAPPSACVTGSGRPYLNSTQPQLLVNVTDPDGGLVQGSFSVEPTGGSVIASGLSAGVQSGSRAFWIVPAGKLANGGTYSWRASAWDGSMGSSGSTPWCEFTVDTVAPAQPAVSSTDYPAGAWHTAGGAGSFTLTDTSTDVDRYLWSVDAATPGTVTGSPLTFTPGDGWHTLSVRAVDRAGNLSAVTAYTFGATPGITSPGAGAKSQGSVTLSSRTAPGATAVTYNWRRGVSDGWAPVPPAEVTNAGVGIGSWPVTFSSGTGDSVPPNLVWNLAHTLSDQDGPVQVQVCFGSSCSTVPVQVTLDETAYGDAYATTGFGPGTLSLLTGNLAVDDTDVTVPAYDTTLTVGRTFNTHSPGTPATGVFGPGWTASLPVDEAGSDFTGLSDAGATVTLTGSDGSTTSFAKSGTAYVPTGEDADTGIKLLTAGGDANGPATFTMSDLDGNNTVFTGSGFTAPASLTGPHAYPVGSVSQPGSNQTTTFSYTSGRPTRILAPIPPGGSCTDPAAASTWSAGCRALTFGYDASNHLTAVTLVTNPGSSVLQVDAACYAYDAAGRLTQAWDPRDGTAGTGGHPVVCGSPVLATSYGYDGSGRLTTITPPGLAAWTLGYDGTGRVSTAARTHNATFGGSAETSTAVYALPVSADGTHPEYRPSVTGADAATWAQTDAPVTAAAVFGPGDSVSTSDLRDAEVHYLDINGRETNTASYAGTGAAGWHLSTTEYNATGNVTRTLDAGNREEALTPTTGAGAALGLPTDTAAAALALSTTNVYISGSDGVADLTDTYGPYHTVALPSGDQVAARAHTHSSYDTGTETGHPAGGLLHLVTSTTTAASLSADPVPTAETDARRTDTAYALSTSDATGWTFRAAMKTVEDPGGLAKTTISRYDPTTGAAIESRMPSNTAGGGAGTTLTRYYTAGANTADAACGNKPAWVNLTCTSTPAAQPGVTGLPGLVTTRTTAYDYLTRPVTVVESVTDAAGAAQTRTTTTTYASSGYGDRVTSTAVTGGLGAATPTKTTSYDVTTGLPTAIAAAATTENAATSATTGYDDFGRTVGYVEADEATGAARNQVTTTYTNGRIAQVTDAHTSITYTYNGGTEHRGLPTALAVTVNSATSYSGTWTANYDPDGQPVTQTDPNGIQQATGRDEAGALVSLTDTKVADGTVWLTDAVTASVQGQWLTHTGPAGTHAYRYDALGRLTTAEDAPTGAGCVHRGYAFDADTNRLTSTTYPAAADGTCQTGTGATTTSHTYDGADRLQPAGVDAGLTYDAFGRTTTTPGYGGLSGTTATTVGYYTNDLARSQTQAGTTRAWTLDAAGRRRTWTDTGTTTATKTNHYTDDSSDSPRWIAETADSAQWTANLDDLAGSLAATCTQAGAVTYQYPDLHGDIVATAAPADTGATITTDYDEYGNPVSGTQARYGWLGGKQRSGDTLNGLTLMGVRLYNPTTGRFLQTDPEPGGSCNDYDYTCADPINAFDLDGNRCWLGRNPDGSCRGHNQARWVGSHRRQIFAWSAGAACSFITAGAALVACLGGALALSSAAYVYHYRRANRRRTWSGYFGAIWSAVQQVGEGWGGGRGARYATKYRRWRRIVRNRRSIERFRRFQHAFRHRNWE